MRISGLLLLTVPLAACGSWAEPVLDADGCRPAMAFYQPPVREGGAGTILHIPRSCPPRPLPATDPGTAAAVYEATREMTDAEFAGWLTSAMPQVCAAPTDGWAARREAGFVWGLTPLPEDEDVDFLLFQGATRLRITLPSSDDTGACRLRLLAPTARLVAVDGALKSWAAGQPMTWNIRDIPHAVTPGTMNRRIRGMRERDEAVLRWAYQPSADDAEVAEMQIEWTAAPPAD